jgi:hypothetical protein
MTIKEIFDKSTNEDKTLTYDEFDAIMRGAKAKFTDLSEGKYVDKQKYEDDLAKKDTEISTLNDTIKTRDTDLGTLKEQLANAGSDANKLEELTNSFTALQTKYDEDTKALNDKLSAQSYEFAVRDFASGQKFTSAAARKMFELEMINKKLPMEDGKIMGADDFVKVYAKTNADSFVQKATTPPANPNPAPPQFAGPTPGGSNTGTKMSLSEMMQKANEDPNFVVSFD